VYLARYFASAPSVVQALSLNTINLALRCLTFVVLVPVVLVLVTVLGATLPYPG
jgi:hypothetical protein